MEKNFSRRFFSWLEKNQDDESSDESFPRLQVVVFYRGIRPFQVASIGTMPWWSYTPWVSGTLGWRFSGGEGELPHGNLHVVGLWRSNLMQMYLGTS